MKALLIANGVLPSARLVLELVSTSDFIACADGGTRHALRLGIQPDVVIGDLDSLSTRMRENLKQVKIIELVDQDKTDLEKAIDYLLKRRAKRITVLGATGKRIDHTLANVALLATYQPRVNLTLVDPTGEILIVQTKVTFPAKRGATVSLLPIDGAPRVTTTGLRYPLTNETLEFGSRGVSNEVVGSTVEVLVRGGRLLLIKLF